MAAEKLQYMVQIRPRGVCLLLASLLPHPPPRAAFVSYFAQDVTHPRLLF